MTSKTLLLAVLASAFLIPISALASDNLYDQLFSDADYTSQDKGQVIEYSTTTEEPVALPASDDQVGVGERAVEIILQMQNTTDPVKLQELQQRLDAMTIELLQAGMVLREKYEENPELWDKLLDHYIDNDKVLNIWDDDPSSQWRPP